MTALFCLSLSGGEWRKDLSFQRGFSVSKCICAPNQVLPFHRQEGQAGFRVTYQEHQLPQREDPVETPTGRTLKFQGDREN